MIPEIFYKSQSLRSLGLFALAASLLHGATQGKQEPVYVSLYARITDHVNLDMTENRLRRVLGEIDSYEKAHPGAHVTATVAFSGAVSRALAERNPKTHIVDFVRDHIRRGVIEAGYDGTDEPTYQQRPVVDLRKTPTPEAKWQARAAAANAFLSENRDPLTGSPQTGLGGLMEMQEVFGPAVSINGVVLRAQGLLMRGVAVTQADSNVPHMKVPGPDDTWPEIGGDPEIVQQLRAHNTSAVMSGIYSTNSAQLAGFGGGSGRFGDLMAPVPEAAPELYWQDNVLRLSEATRTTKPVRASDGAEALKAILAKVDRSTVQILSVELGSVQGYLKPAFVKGPDFPPLKYAYAHPQNPQLPPDVLASPAEVDAAYAKEEDTLRWLTGDFFSANAGSRVIATAELARMTPPSTGFNVSVVSLQSALGEMLKAWGNDTFPPPYLRVDQRYLSMADMFQVMTDALAEFHRTGKLPQSVAVVPTYGPLRLVTGHGPNVGEVSVSSIAAKCSEIAPALHDVSASPVPKNMIPSMLEVDGIAMNPAQFVRLMAAALINPSPDTKLRVRMTYMLAESSAVFPKSRPLPDAGFTWTFKPAPIVLDQQPLARQ